MSHYTHADIWLTPDQIIVVPNCMYDLDATHSKELDDSFHSPGSDYSCGLIYVTQVSLSLNLSTHGHLGERREEVNYAN